MSLFLNRIKNEANNRQRVIKNELITQLSECIKEIQFGNTGGDISGDSFDVNNPELCNIIESIFLNGLKDSFLSQAKRVFSDMDQRPVPSFWPPLMLISHRQIIDQIEKSSQINTEVGQCRAWIRIALNDSLLSSYFFSIQQNISAMKAYYNTYAYLRDSEFVDVSQKLIEGLESSITFNFPTNSSLLNIWPQETLILAGIWSPTLRTCPVASGIDIAQSMQTTKSFNSETSSLDSLMSSVSSLGLRQVCNEDEALKIILNKNSISPKYENKKIERIEKNIEHSTPKKKTECSEDILKNDGDNLEVVPLECGNSLTKHLGWSFDGENSEKVENKDNSCEIPGTSANTKSMETSYNALIESYNISNGGNGKIPTLSDVIVANKVADDQNLEATEDKNGLNIKTSFDDWKCFLLKIGTIAKEVGLDNQNFECKDCNLYLGLTQKWGTCKFSGYYYCKDCMHETNISIPSRIVHNWDFQLYPVSKQAIKFIDDIKEFPTINLKILNPSIYSFVSDMAKLQKLRVQLNYLRDYMFSCHEPIIEELRNKIGGREYMYEHIHQYSILDLLEIPNGNLSQCIQEVVDFGRKHVFSCCVCSQKGFICEICNNSKILYPFDIDKVYRCSDCNSIYHKSCLNKNKPCPKCERRRKKTDLILGAETN